MTAAEIATVEFGYIPIAGVRVGERARRDYGDLEPLKASIAEHGLLQPIVLLPDDYLLCGGRRLEACRQLGWQSIPSVLSSTQTDAIARLRAERDENTCRKDMTPSELVAIGKKLEELHRPAAEERQRQGVRLALDTFGPDGPKVESDDGHAVRREVAEAVGMSERSYARAKRVVETSEDETEDDDVRLAAMVARDDMDSGQISINQAEEQVRKAKGVVKPTVVEPSPTRLPEAQRVEQIRARCDSGMTSGQIAAEIGIGEEQVRNIARRNGITITADEVLRGTHRLRIDSNHIVNHAVMTLDALIAGFDVIRYPDLDTAQTENWVESLTSSIAALNRFKKKIKESTQ